MSLEQKKKGETADVHYEDIGGLSRLRDGEGDDRAFRSGTPVSSAWGSIPRGVLLYGLRERERP